MSDITELDRRSGGDLPALNGRSAPAGQATQVEQARAIAEVRAAVMIAMDRPRDRSAALAEMREVCGIPMLAERAFFRVKRGAEYVNGESIHLARELARIWGNIDAGVKELARDDIRGQSELLAFAWDLQTNARHEITFIVPHVRGSGDKRKRLLGTQEIYENNASFAGRRLREAIFAVLPVWFKAEAADLCHKTLEGGGSGKPLVQRIADLRVAFADIGVTAAQLEQKRGRRIDDFLPEDVAALRVVYGSIKREEVTVAEEFPSEDRRSPTRSGDKLGVIEGSIQSDSPHSPPAQDQPSEQEKGVRADGDRVGTSAPAGQPPHAPRDDAFWNGESYALDVPATDPRAFQAAMHAKLREARHAGEVIALRDANGPAIDALPKAYREDVLGALMDREKALREGADG